MKKKIIFIFVAIILIVLSVLIGISIRKIGIYNNMVEAYNKFKILDNYEVTCIETSLLDDKVFEKVETIKYKNGKRLLVGKNEVPEYLTNLKIYSDYNRKTEIVINELKKEYEERTIDEIVSHTGYIPGYPLLGEVEGLISYIKTSLELKVDETVVDGIEYYLISFDDNFNMYVNKETFLIEKIKKVNQEENVSEFTFNIGTVLEDDVSAPDLTDYIKNN